MATHLFRVTDIAALPETASQHQFNDNALRHVKTLTNLAELTRIGLHVVRLESGRESTEQHSHDNDEEFLVVLAGRGRANIGAETFEVAAGDLMAFGCQSPAHSLHNPYEEDLVYVMGGEKNANDVVHYPRLQKSMVKSAGKRHWSHWQDQNELPEKF